MGENGFPGLHVQDISKLGWLHLLFAHSCLRLFCVGPTVCRIL
jgi:hypothetical protein